MTPSPSVRILGFEPADQGGGIVRAVVADVVVVELALRHLPTGDPRICWPQGARPADLDVTRGIEATTLRLLAARGDLAAAADQDDDEIEAQVRHRVRQLNRRR